MLYIRIFGCGKIATEFYHTYKEQIRICYAISNNSDEKVFSPEIGTVYEVYRPKAKMKKEDLIVICCTDYGVVAEQLILLGYIPFEDFMDYEMASLYLKRKKIALLYGFCHLRGVRDCLQHSEKFMASYQPYYYASYQPYNAYQQLCFNYLVTKCDLFIYGMAVTIENYRKNTAIMGRLKTDTKKLCLPAVYFGGYFPQKQRSYNHMNRFAVKCEGYDYTPFAYGDSWLNECIEQRIPISEILERLYNATIYDRDFVLKYLEMELKHLKIQEKQGDFIFLDYIMENYQRHRLFRNEAHMENEVLEFYAQQVMQKLEITDNIVEINEPLMRCSQHLIYPGVAKILGLNWNVEEEKLDCYTYSGWKKLTVQEYVEYYVESCSRIKYLKNISLLP